MRSPYILVFFDRYSETAMFIVNGKPVSYRYGLTNCARTVPTFTIQPNSPGFVFPSPMTHNPPNGPCYPPKGRPDPTLKVFSPWRNLIATIATSTG